MVAVRVPLTGGWSFSLNPGPFSIKEHDHISFLAGSGANDTEGVTDITMMKVFYKKKPAAVAILPARLVNDS